MKNGIEILLKKNPLTYKVSFKIYKVLRSLNNTFHIIYIKAIEFFLSPSYVVQYLPDLRNENLPLLRSEIDLYNAGSNRINRDGVRVIMAKYLLDRVLSLEEGDYAELGTYQGNFAKLIFKYKKAGTTLYCFDTFEGFDKKDVAIEQSLNGLILKEKHFSDTSLDIVRRNITGDAKDDTELKLMKGYFPDTFSGQETKKWRFVNLDADLYEPMKEGVKAFWPNMVSGGVLLIHDYNGKYAGTKTAIDEYFTPLGIKPIALPDKVGSALIIKP